jgi:hypothetical protein
MTTIRRGTKADLTQTLELIRELALYEKAPEQVNNTVARMEIDGFGEKSVFEFFVAEEGHYIKAFIWKIWLYENLNVVRVWAKSYWTL